MANKFYDNPQDRRDRILLAALQLFSEKGYFNTSVHDIRQRADVSIGLVYRYFGNKEAIAQTLYTELMLDTVQVLEGFSAAHPTFHGRCHAIVAHFFAMTDQFPELVDYLLFARHREIMPTVKPVCTAEPSEIVFSWIQEAMQEGVIRQMHPVIAHTALFGGMFKFIQARLDGAVESPMGQYVDEVWQCAWRAVAIRP